MAKAKKKQKLNLELLVLCDYAIVSNRNKLSVLGFFDRIFVNKTPARHAKMFVVGLVKGKPDSSHSLKLIIKDPSGKGILPGQELKVKLGPNGASNLIAELGNLPLPLTGEYRVIVSSSEGKLGEKTFGVYQTGVKDGKQKQHGPN